MQTGDNRYSKWLYIYTYYNIIYIYIERERERNVFKTNLQDSHYSLTLKLIGHVLHVRKNVTSLKHKGSLVINKIIMIQLNHQGSLT